MDRPTCNCGSSPHLRDPCGPTGPRAAQDLQKHLVSKHSLHQRSACLVLCLGQTMSVSGISVHNIVHRKSLYFISTPNLRWEWSTHILIHRTHRHEQVNWKVSSWAVIPWTNMHFIWVIVNDTPGSTQRTVVCVKQSKVNTAKTVWVIPLSVVNLYWITMDIATSVQNSFWHFPIERIFLKDPRKSDPL